MTDRKIRLLVTVVVVAVMDGFYVVRKSNYLRRVIFYDFFLFHTVSACCVGTSLHLGRVAMQDVAEINLQQEDQYCMDIHMALNSLQMHSRGHRQPFGNLECTLECQGISRNAQKH